MAVILSRRSPLIVQLPDELFSNHSMKTFPTVLLVVKLIILSEYAHPAKVELTVKLN